jgi:hypothetical protein
LDLAQEVAERFERSVGPDDALPVRVGDREFDPLIALIKRYSLTKLAADKTPHVVVRMQAKVYDAQPLGQSGQLAQWTSPATPIFVMYYDWPNVKFPGGTVPTDEYVVIGTLGDLHEWIHRSHEDLHFEVVDLLLVGFVPLMVGLYAYLVEVRHEKKADSGVVAHMTAERNATKWLTRNWASPALLLVVVAATVLFYLYWSDSSRLAALASLLGFIITAVLVATTIEYVRINQKTLGLLKAQWKAQNEIEVKFGLRAHAETAQVWALNYGLANVVLTKLLVEIPGGKPESIHKNMILRSGAKKVFSLPHRQWGKLQLKQNIQLTLFCESTTQKFEATKVYTLSLTEASKVYEVRKGLHGLWPVRCPRCKKFEGIHMSTDSLKSFNDARQREQEMEAELGASCPKHASKWMLTMEQVTKPEAGNRLKEGT